MKVGDKFKEKKSPHCVIEITEKLDGDLNEYWEFKYICNSPENIHEHWVAPMDGTSICEFFERVYE
jgi:hypothetical protein